VHGSQRQPLFVQPQVQAALVFVASVIVFLLVLAMWQIAY
jgi:hypothetical protein